MIGKKTIVQTEQHELRLDGIDITELLRKAGLVPADQTIHSICFRVPGGGDYSNMNIEVGADTPIIVKWTRENRDG